MIMSVYVYRDRRLGVYMSPVFSTFERKVDFVESIRRGVNSKEYRGTIDDCEIYFLGTFDDKTGLFQTVVPEFLASVSDLKMKIEEAAKHGTIEEPAKHGTN